MNLAASIIQVSESQRVFANITIQQSAPYPRKYGLWVSLREGDFSGFTWRLTLSLFAVVNPVSNSPCDIQTYFSQNQ
jgi:hypothetical protein